VIVPPLPASLAPPPPFPAVLSQSHTTEFVAPGVRRATYRLETADGPLVVNVVAVDPREPSVRLGTVVANDRMISSGEPISSMARRTGAVAGINADYFDIGNTNQPLNVVVTAGALLRTPSKRVVFDVRTGGSIRFERFSFSGSVQSTNATVPLTAVNEWPPQGGASFLTPAYGALKPAPGVTVEELVPADPVHPAAAVAGVYRVAAVDDVPPAVPSGPLLAFGPAAKAVAPLPAAGDTLTVSASTSPPLDDVACAVGGGPLLLTDGNIAADPNAPAPEETNVHFPVAGAATTPGGELLLAAVDGRGPALSIGVTRPQFAALLLGFGASDAMAFDSGGSATLVARVLGERDASVQNAPSDGEERPVADGLFVYSDAPLGPATQLVVRPAGIVALPHARVPISLALVDAAGHTLGPAHLRAGDAVRAGAVSGVAVLRAAGVSADLPVDVVPRVQRLALEASARVAQPGQSVVLRATGFDARGRVVALGDAVRWRAGRGRFVAPGVYRAAARDALIVAEAPGARATYVLHVGMHREALPLFDAEHGTMWRGVAAPQGLPEALSLSPDAVLTLPYDFTGSERAAYADADIALPGEPLSFAIEVEGDGNGVGVRAAFVNRFGERRALTIAKSVDWSGWQARTIVLPPDLNPPVRLIALYVVDSLANAATHARGSLSFRNASVDVAGTP
jgi:hypothetical protein